jgi:thermostable 8-oxoguanine DNA glycosylase
MTNIELYEFAYNFLLSKKGITRELIEKHFVPEFDKPNNLNDIFQRLCHTAQNKQMSTKVIGGSIGGVENLRKVLFDFNPKQVCINFSKSEKEELLNEIILKLQPKGQIRRTSRSIWPQFCQSVLDSAYFINEFENAESFYNWANLFANDEKTKPALPLLISLEISGIGFPLACDFLKEIGYLNFGKPDVHLKEVFKELNLIDPNEKSTIKQDYQTLKLIDKIALENNTTAFEVDKIFWLIGSGNFYLSKINIGRNRNEFIKEAKKHYTQQRV